MADITSLNDILKLQHKEQMEKQDRQRAEPIAVLIAQVKTRELKMKHLIEAALDMERQGVNLLLLERFW